MGVMVSGALRFSPTGDKRTRACRSSRTDLSEGPSVLHEDVCTEMRSLGRLQTKRVAG